MSTDVLPVPDPAALTHSQRVKDALLASIQAEGPLSFGDYMQFVLYSPGFGYYMNGSEKIGVAGDFVTAPAVSPLFGSCLARQAAQVLDITGGDILELGAGTGELALSVLSSLHDTGERPPNRYAILEPSAELAARQRELLNSRLPAESFQRIEWLSELPHEFVGVIIANEVLDAMPVERFVLSPGSTSSHSGLSDASPVVSDEVGQMFVSVAQDQLCTLVQPAAPVIEAEVRQLQRELQHPLPVGYCSEVNVLLEPWLRSVAESISCGLVILIDYGFPENEYYLPDRSQGTLRCFFRHHVHADALLYPGLQDITTDVNFTQVARSASRVGLELHGYTSQAQFLIGNGLTEHAARLPANSETERYRIAQQVNTLSSSTAMGDRFQVLGLSKCLDADLHGFIRVDFSHRL